MSAITFITATPRDRTGQPVVVRLAGGGAETPFVRDGQHFAAGLFDRPRFRAELGFGPDGWTGGTVPTTGEITWMPAEPARLRPLADLYWPDAQIIVEGGPEAGPIGRLLTGAVANAAVAEGLLKLTVADLSAAIDKPLVTASFAGTGGLEGPAEATGKPKRRSWGRVFNVEARPLVPSHEIHEVGDPTRPLTAIPVVRDKGREGPIEVLGWAGSAAATLDALKDRVPPRGGAIAAPSIAAVRWWTTPSGPLTCDLVGEVGVEPAVVPIASAVLAAVAGPLVADVAAARALRPATAGLHVGTATETAAQALDRLLLGVSLLWVLEPSGLVRIREWSWETGTAPALQARFIARERTLPPMSRRRVGYRANNRVHTAAEISAALLLEDAAASPDYQLPTPQDIEKLGGIDAGATNTRAYVGVEPADPKDGDSWVASFGSPVVTYLRVAGEWVDAANIGVTTVRSPRAPSPDQPVGSLYIDAANVQYRLEGVGLTFGGEPVGHGGAELVAPAFVELLPEPVRDATYQVEIAAPADQTVFTDAAGDPLPGQFPRVLTPTVKRGGLSIRTSDDVAYRLTTTRVTASVNNERAHVDKGRIRVTAADLGSCDLYVRVTGREYGPHRVRFLRQAAAPADAGGTGAKRGTDTTFPLIVAGELAEVAGPITVTLAEGERIECTLPASYSLSSSHSAASAVAGRWEHKAAGATDWTPAGAEIVGSVSSWQQDVGSGGEYDPEPDYSSGGPNLTQQTVSDGRFSGTPGEGRFNQTVTGLGLGDVVVRFVARLTAPSPDTRAEIFNSTASVVVRT